MTNRGLSDLFLRMVIGSLMVIHAFYTLILYQSYLDKLDYYLSSINLTDSNFFAIVAPLFPFIEILLGMLLFFKIKIKMSTISSYILMLFVLITHYVLCNLQIASVLTIMVLSLILVRLYLDNLKYSQNYLRKSK